MVVGDFLWRVGLESSRNLDCDEKSLSHKGPSSLPGDNEAFSWGPEVALQSGPSVQCGEGVLACARPRTMVPIVGGWGLVFTSGIQGAAWWAGGHGSLEGPENVTRRRWAPRRHKVRHGGHPESSIVSRVEGWDWMSSEGPIVKGQERSLSLCCSQWLLSQEGRSLLSQLSEWLLSRSRY